MTFTCPVVDLFSFLPMEVLYLVRGLVSHQTHGISSFHKYSSPFLLSALLSVFIVTIEEHGREEGIQHDEDQRLCHLLSA